MMVVFDKTNVSRGTRLLDVGCGTGMAAQLAAKLGALVTSIDTSLAYLRVLSASHLHFSLVAARLTRGRRYLLPRVEPECVFTARGVDAQTCLLPGPCHDE